MKIFFLLFSANILTMTSFAQSVNELDSSGGFKEFKIGDPKSIWQAFLSNKNLAIANTYDYTGDCCKTAFGFPLKSIDLKFNDRNTLEKIFLIFKDRQNADGQKQLLDDIQNAFGIPTDVNKEKNTENFIVEWAGNMIDLTMVCDYKGADEGGWEITIIVGGKESSSDPSKNY